MIWPVFGDKFPSASSTGGFSLIELVVVIGITVMLMSVMIAYNSASRQQIALSVERVKIAQVIARAKSRSMNAFEPLVKTCAYGVQFNYTANPQTYRFVRYDAISTSSPCVFTNFADPGAASVNGVIETYTVPKGITLGSIASNPSRMEQIAFVPPEPKTLMVDSTGNSLSPSAYVYLSAGSNASGTITVSTAGLISY